MVDILPTESGGGLDADGSPAKTEHVDSENGTPSKAVDIDVNNAQEAFTSNDMDDAQGVGFATGIDLNAEAAIRRRQKLRPTGLFAHLTDVGDREGPAAEITDVGTEQRATFASNTFEKAVGSSQETKAMDGKWQFVGHDKPQAASPPPVDDAADAPEDDARDELKKTCRICFCGVEEESALGQLISPCMCRGTSRYVHVHCLNAWRKASARKESFFQCDLCKYKYRISRTTMASIASSQIALTLLTIVVFAVSAFFGGFLMKAILRAMHSVDGDPTDSFYDELRGLDNFDTLFDFDHSALHKEAHGAAPGDDPFGEQDVLDRLDLSLTTIDTTHLILGVLFTAFVGLIHLMVTQVWLGPFPTFGG